MSADESSDWESSDEVKKAKGGKKKGGVFDDDSDNESRSPVKVTKKKKSAAKAKAKRSSPSPGPVPSPPAHGSDDLAEDITTVESSEDDEGSDAAGSGVAAKRRPLWNEGDYRVKYGKQLAADTALVKKGQIFAKFTETEETADGSVTVRKFPHLNSKKDTIEKAVRRFFESDTTDEKKEDGSEEIAADYRLDVRTLKPTQATQFALGMLSAARPVYENVGEDNHRPFLVDLDSLMFDLLQTSETLCAPGSVQTLALIYALESRMDLLCGGGRSIHVVAFRSGRRLYARNCDLLLREAALYHLLYHWQYAVNLESGNTTPLVYVFDNCWDQEFALYTNDCLPVFGLVCTDLHSVEHMVAADAYFIALALPLYLTALEVPCVHSTELTFNSNAMYGFSLDFDTNDCVRFVRRCLLGPRTVGQPPTVIPLSGTQSPLDSESLAASKWKLDPIHFDNLTASPLSNMGTDLRTIASIHAVLRICAKALDGADVDKQQLGDFARAVALHCTLLEMLSANDRCQALAAAIPQSDEMKTMAFTPQFATLFEDFCKEVAMFLAIQHNDADSGPLVSEGTILADLNKRDFGDDVFRADNGSISKEHKDNRYLVYSPLSATDLFDSQLFAQSLYYATKTQTAGDSSDEMMSALKKSSRLSGLFGFVFEAANLPSECGCSALPVLQSATLLSAIGELLATGSEETAHTSQRDYALVPLGDASWNKALTDSVDREMSRCGLVSQSTRGRELKRRLQKWRSFLENRHWIAGGQVSDQLKDKVETARESQLMIRFLEKYAMSLEGGKVILRDVSGIQKKKKTAAAAAESKASTRKKGRSSKGGKGRNEMRERVEKELREKQRSEALEKIDNLISLCESQVSDLEPRISRLDEALSSMDDAITALPGLNKLHEWCHEAAVNCRIERSMYPCVRLWQVVFDIFRRFVEAVDETNEEALRNAVFPDIALMKRLQLSLYMFGFEKPAKEIAEVYVTRVNAKRKLKVAKKPTIVSGGGGGKRGRKKKAAASASTTTTTTTATASAGQITIDDVMVPFRMEYVRQAVGSSYARFQMQHCGPFMIRGMGSVKDERVDGFYPDAWQVKLLDICDRRQSCLVVAPTSSGKTYVSYYCMKKVLSDNERCKREVDKGVVVYVAPTRALVYQALADLYSKYAAKYGDVFGTYVTKNPPRKVLHSQVLICEPETFEQLLMSPDRAFITTRIKYVIFDEIHCLGRSEGGQIWERLLMLCRAPFFALSATVGGADKFLGWLRKIENTKRDDEKYVNRVHLVCFNERWSDLEKYIYLPDKQVFGSQFELVESGVQVGGCGEDFKSACIKLHPGAALALGTDMSAIDEWPQGLHLSPQDSMLLYDAMNKEVSALPKHFGERMAELRPDLCLDSVYITKSQANDYAKRLTNELRYWLTSHESMPRVARVGLAALMKAGEDYGMPPEDEDIRAEWLKGASGKRGRKRKPADDWKREDAAEEKRGGESLAVAGTELMRDETKRKRRQVVHNVMRTLAEYPTERMERLSELAVSQSTTGVMPPPVEGFDFVLNNMTQLLLDLDAFDRMPVLVFCLDRVRCEELFVRVVEDLEKLSEKSSEREAVAKGVSRDAEEVHKHKADTKKLAALEKELERLIRNDVKEKGDSSRPNPQIEAMENQIGELQAALAGKTDTDWRFTFQKQGFEMDAEEKDWWTSRVKKRGVGDSSPLMRGLSRGVGIHHNGLSFQYRSLVETLFRYKDIKVVITQASLAMGVNMPARTVVFAGDDSTLTPLNYRQMMGRAGRRGYDNVGNVIFCGISARKVAYLMTSPLTGLHGHYPITTTMPLRAIAMSQGYGAVEGQPQYAQWSLDALSNLFHAPFTKLRSGDADESAMEKQIREAFRFALEYHSQMGLLDPVTQWRAARSGAKGKKKKAASVKTGKSILAGLSGLVAHLHQFEPDNYAFARLLQNGQLHRLCAGYNKLGADPHSAAKRSMQRALLLVLCHIFARRPLPYGYDFALHCAKTGAPLSTLEAPCVELPKLSDAGFEGNEAETLRKIEVELRTHNAMSGAMFAEYFRICADASERGTALSLPQSGVCVSQPSRVALAPFMAQRVIDFKARSALSALRGRGDSFASVWDFAEGMSNAMAVEPSMLPLCEWSDLRGRSLALNAYVYDFYNHGSFDRILAENLMYDKLAYDSLMLFNDALRCLKECFADISNIAYEAKKGKRKLEQEIGAFKKAWQPVRKQRRKEGIIFKGLHYKCWETREIINEYEYKKRIEALKQTAYGDDLVACFSDMEEDFYKKYRSIKPTGAISRGRTV